MVFGCGVGAGCTSPKAPPGTVSEATQAAEAWLKLVDDGAYDESWTQAASLFREAMPQAQWRSRMSSLRAPLGALKSREVKSASYTRQLGGAPDGEYVVIQFSATFANKASAVETVTPMKDKDGTWRVSGYYIR